MPNGAEKFYRFLPDNIAPDQFMRAPTEGFEEQFIQASYELEARINELAACSLIERALIFRKPLSALRRKPTLNIGSELEILLFSKKSTPHMDAEKLRRENPNYSSEHRKRLGEIGRDVTLSVKHGGLGDAITPAVDLESLMLEVRTQPGTVAEYTVAISQIQAWFRAQGNKKGINPAIFSQHFHFSLTDSIDEQNLLKDDKNYKAVHVGVTDTYHRAIPLLRLPEEFTKDQLGDGSWSYTIGSSGDGVIKTGEGGRNNTGPTRIECRVNSSEHADDPYLNLFVNLLGVYRGLSAKDDPDALSEGYRMFDTGYDGFPYFKLGGRYDITFTQAMARLPEDPALKTALPGDSVDKLHKILQSYPGYFSGENNSRPSKKRSLPFTGKC